MDAIRTLLETQPLFSLFLTIALGYLVGEINIKELIKENSAVKDSVDEYGDLTKGIPFSTQSPIKPSWDSSIILKSPTINSDRRNASEK